ncbi:hypothetical protein DIPPA_00476 [Diplonema papillatum]|nr:hypothetical protein DIPPA_00476 [Diplonema papillatum]
MEWVDWSRKDECELLRIRIPGPGEASALLEVNTSCMQSHSAAARAPFPTTRSASPATRAAARATSWPSWRLAGERASR